MASWEHGGGFSLDASVRVESADRTGLERLRRNSRSTSLRRGAFAGSRRRTLGLSECRAGFRRQPELDADAARTERASGGADSIPAPSSASVLRRDGAQRSATRTGQRAGWRAKESDRAAWRKRKERAISSSSPSERPRSACPIAIRPICFPAATWWTSSVIGYPPRSSPTKTLRHRSSTGIDEGTRPWNPPTESKPPCSQNQLERQSDKIHNL